MLIVVAIIAILAAIAVPNFLEAQTRAKVSRCVSDMRSLATAIETYQIDNRKPPPLVALTSPLARNGSGAINGPSVFYSNVTAAVSSRYVAITTPISYMNSVPRDPFIGANTRFALSAANGTLDQPINEYDTYDYVDAATVWAGGRLGGTRGSALSSGANWHVVGCGPDRRNAFGGGQSDYDVGVRARGVDYDPSNGTLSAGDVVRIGSAPHAHGTLRPTINRITGRYNAVP